MASSKLVLLALAAPWLGGAPARAELAEEARALEVDDQCAVGDEACAFNAMQLRGARIEAEEDLEGAEVHPHHHHHSDASASKQDVEDLSSAWSMKLSKMIALLGDNITVMEWKMYYMMMDVASTNQTLFNVPNRSIGVNGTEVNWNSHPPTWIPTFDGAASLLEAERPHHHHKKGKEVTPPHMKQVQGEMTLAQKRLNAVWQSTSDFERDVNWVNNYMGFHKRKLNGRFVLEQQAAERAEDASEWSEDKKDIILNQIDSAWNQSYKIWPTFHKLGKEMEQLKVRVARYMSVGGPATLLEDEAYLEDEAVEDAADDEAVAEDEGMALLEELTAAEWSIFGTMEQCCKCKTGTLGWSASGKCSFCKTGVATKKSVSAECVKSKKGFKGNQFCANSCGKVLR
mmetsp:Transcript_99469/g.278551  ORF Transcript_99469/g.278551 Transcript_99469/m.278551 type:complete len:400 (-) Transcript_99469:103-1302(-)